MEDFAYDPANWYWIVGGDATKVYSSDRTRYVPYDDSTYIAWLASGGQATKIATPGELDQVLKAAGLPGTMPSSEWDWGRRFIEVIGV